MKYQSKDLKAPSKEGDETFKLNQTHLVMQSSLTETLDSLVEYLVDNEIDGIHPLIMGEIEKRLIIKVLERSRGNKLRAAINQCERLCQYTAKNPNPRTVQPQKSKTSATGQGGIREPPGIVVMRIAA